MKVSTLSASFTDTAAITALVDATAGMMFLITPSVSLSGSCDGRDGGQVDAGARGCCMHACDFAPPPPPKKKRVPVGDALDAVARRALRGLVEDPLDVLGVVRV